jgi:hypothetical protein
VDFGIKRYQVYFYSIPPESYVTSPTATIFLYDTSDVCRGELVFYRTLLLDEPSVGPNAMPPTVIPSRVYQSLNLGLRQIFTSVAIPAHGAIRLVSRYGKAGRG